MGNKESAQNPKGVAKGVIEQTYIGSNKLYQDYIALKGDGNLLEAFRKAQATKDYTEVEQLVEGCRGKFLYNEGVGEDIEVRELVQSRKQTRKVQDTSFFTFLHRLKCTNRVENSDKYVVNFGKYKIDFCY